MPLPARATCELPLTSHSENITALTALLPGNARGVLAVDINSLLAGSSAMQVSGLLNNNTGDPALRRLFSAINVLAENIDLTSFMKTAMLVQTTDVSEGLFLLARLDCDTITEVTRGPDPAFAETYGTGHHAVYLDLNGNYLSLLSGGLLIAGRPEAVQSVLDVVDGAVPANAAAIMPFLSVLQSGSAFSFVYGLPAMFNSAMTTDRSLRGAALLSGSLDFSGSAVSGSVSFHMDNASDFVDNYNQLDRASGDAPLVLASPIAGDLGRVTVPVPSTPISKSPDELISSRNILKKLFPVMQAYDYAEDVADPGNSPWLDFLVSSEADGEGSPGSVFIRWEFKDQDAIDAFEASALPAGFSLAPCQFLESDVPGYFLVLNLYNSAGPIVNGARAEWDVFVYPPGEASRPRFMVIDALAEAVSADSVNGLTPPEPLSHRFVSSDVVSSVAKFEEGLETAVFSLRFPRPEPTADNIARFTREMAVANDHIYWGNGVFDRGFYNASTFKCDAVLADLDRVEIIDNSSWKPYLKADPSYVVYYLNTLEYVVSPWYNLDSPDLDVTPEWLSDLYDFKNSGNYLTLMRGAVRSAFTGTGDVLIKGTVSNTVPAVYYSFKVTDPAGLAAALELPADFTLAKSRLLKSDAAEDYYLTLAIYRLEDALEGFRAEWRVSVDNANGSGCENFMVIDLQTGDAAVDPVYLINLPGEVSHRLDGDTLQTRLSSAAVHFDAAVSVTGAEAQALSLEWVGAEDYVCFSNGICDKWYYDGETLDVPVQVPDVVTINDMSTPWDAFIEATPSRVFFRDNAREFLVKPWHNLKVIVDDSEPPEIGEGTHVITGSGALTGKTNPALDSSYTYTGAASLSGNSLVFTIDQEIENALGKSDIVTSGSFDLTTGSGISTALSCTGPLLVCAGVDPVIGTPAATSDYTAANLDAADPDCITWDVVFTLDVPGFGEADSASRFAAALSSNCTDRDRDGYFAEGGCCGTADCDDTDPETYPGAAEKCGDVKDNDCDGTINEDCDCLAEQLFSRNDPGLKILRRFRDEILYRSGFGTGLVDLYYAGSDELITLMEDSPEIRTFFKGLFETLLPVMALMLNDSE